MTQTGEGVIMLIIVIGIGAFGVYLVRDNDRYQKTLPPYKRKRVKKDENNLGS